MQTTSNASIQSLAFPSVWASRKQTGSDYANHRERNTRPSGALQNRMLLDMKPALGALVVVLCEQCVRASQRRVLLFAWT